MSRLSCSTSSDSRSRSSSRPRVACPSIEGTHIDYRHLRLPGIEFEWITVTLDAGSAFRETLAHPGFDIVYVPFGEIVVVYGGVDYTMRAGDTGVWPGNVPHSFRNDTDAPASFVAAVTQTVWGSDGSTGRQPDETRESE